MGKKRNKFSGQKEQNAAANLLDEVVAFDDFRSTVLPALQKAVKEGWTAEKIYKMAETHAAARAVSLALTEVDSTKALAGIKEILDRGLGKATERREVKTQISNLSDEDLDSLLKSELADGDPATH